MFGAVCSGRPIQLANQVEPTKYVLTIPNASNVSHIAVFLLPNTQFTDPQYTALVYFQMPGSQEFDLLGGLSPLKQSAIFKLNNTNKQTKSGEDMNIDDSVIDNDTAVINVGISIEPTAQAEQLLLQEKQKQASQSSSLVLASSMKPIPRNPNDIALLANKIVGHAYNFLGSFIDNSGKVSMKAFDSWWDKFRAKLANNPNFLDELQQ